MKYVTLGDPHLGRKFRTGVPLHRIGDREKLVWKEFENSLMTPGDADHHICMGDLFDKFVVAPEVVLRAAATYRRAAEENWKVKYWVIRGNHDSQRDSSKASSFDIFTQLVKDMENVIVVNTEMVYEAENVAFIPYDPFTPVVEQIKELPDDLETVFMHHDYVDFGGDHVIPTELLAEKGITHVVNGHDHVQRTETRHGVTVEITGSMQPYTHAEDPRGLWYQTHPLDELDLLDEAFLAGLNLRVLLKEGEALPTEVDCLSMIGKRVTEEGEELEVDTTDFDAFDIKTALSDAVHPDVRDTIMEKFDAS